ncbi:MAG: hypothetical protein V4616_09355 [Bacteroidota bacterium]
MNQLLLWGSIAAGFFLLSVILFLLAIARKNVRLSLISIIPFALSGITGCYAAYIAINLTYYKVVNEVNTGDEQNSYRTLLGGEPDACVEVLNYRNDSFKTKSESVWIKANCCGSEVARLMATGDLRAVKTTPSAYFVDRDADWPEWFTPWQMGDSILVLQRGSGREILQEVYVSADSTELYVVKMNIP